MEEIPSKIYFVHMTIAIESSNTEWLKKVLTERPEEIPLRAKSCSESTLTILLENYRISRLLNEADLRGTTPLIVAAWHGNFAALKYFLALGCETDPVINDTKKNALHCAADLDDPQLCSQLLKYNSRRSFIDAIDDEGNTPLMIAVREGSPCVNVLLLSGADYKYQNIITGRNILHTSILFFHSDLFIKLLRIFNETKIISAIDLNGDTPFMLAIRLKNYACVKILTNHVPINKLLTNSGNCIHYLIKHDDIGILSVLMSSAKNLDFLEWMDEKGRTPLMFAIETQRLDVVIDILFRQRNLQLRNPNNGETVLHIAAYANNEEIMKALLSVKGVEEIIDVKDYEGRTAFEIILSRSGQSCYRALKNSRLLDPFFYNSKKESPLYIAARKGNYSIVLNLLLSNKFFIFHKLNSEFTKLQLIRAELRGQIYSSDVYIVCGETLDHVWNKAPEQNHLFEHNVDNKNIFHACVIGGSLLCLAFMYNYCVRFNDHWRELDFPDKYGSTPLLYAMQAGQESISRFLVQHGANLIFTNKNGEYPLSEMVVHIPQYKELFLGMINECVVEDFSKKRMGKSSGIITIFYYILCPPGLKQMAVVRKIFVVFNNEQDFDILRYPLIEYFIELQWQKLKKMIVVRLNTDHNTEHSIYLY
uniref:ANK_REP_REGION domain-containing protein n=1 Tax=Rhodnius prolixus TaxID=13249 RepID=T1HMU9_RHOPR